jgi:RNA polymerase sigma-70 factor (ECF subfamily)
VAKHTICSLDAGTAPGAGSVRAERRAIVAYTTHTLPHDDPELLGALLASLEPRLTAVALRFTRDPDSARDVVQNAFEKVVRHGAGFAGQSRVSTWMHRIVANEALMWLRSEKRRRELHPAAETESDAVADPAPAACDELDRRRGVARLRQAIVGLAPEERDVMEQCALGGLSYVEFSAATGVHAAAVKTRAFRARRRLATQLESSRTSTRA